ncbi:hypothetical protein CAPTEDRAFT_185076 [Capitella teleta]|uniref:Ubiquitin-like domain-containing protein n=1 Tax=Capitella teleta TaxID=283909 RepID=R7TWV1_CAPTE|nr:hypothetical protein CAPTEDRAFT_185076 [Capitella teleta]|eukprot:ELT98219.1 hypothetical protein CAPTEDRAFT_185076 [Capitella teleta]
MSFVEGIGDEVLLVFSAVVLGLVIALAWISTHVGDAPPVLIILDRNRWLQVLERLRNTIGVTVTNINIAAPQAPSENAEAPATASPESESAATETAPAATPPPNTEPSEDDWENLQQQGYIRVRVKYLSDRERLLIVKPQCTIGELKRDNFQEELSQNIAVRIVYQGQELKAEGATLSSCNITDNSVIHIVLTQRPTPSSSPPSSPILPQESFNIGILLAPTIAICLGSMWFFRFQYKQYFSAMATICLVGITFLFGLIAYAGYQRPQPRQHAD